ncbi:MULTISPECIES: TetR/AcrR family transcriptional regulator [Bacillota]|jgi:AcrR family transcriptional regulator|uniref:TetR/AcrR family transcriptional regulator n=2 Tax=Amedibacillus TaxID=2749846 RepID=A0A7G9GRN8_9FIRM|nr:MULTISPECIES: TetR/AcrR family transcriptional regulator [Bacillota]QNM13470.1 TetR/AcrR family transcriptional regulator [[Eubacterium] hominis]MCH4286325.1 TetR/AcrR family transcriptional regulator [Amedibacillus hominis]RGB51705.1 TetR/AcrR family transcriptional regulator [Absiella sp. AM22-9]RGB57233.1 TetR/AcrR family transcriptional regulator [Absiella sp. AM10-20]RGB68516.1 TetR/AcrR family transcriptional regulator [Absiella sp. AM09-45]
MGKRAEQAISTKRKLLYTAYQLIRDEGYPALTIRKLCEKSDVSTGAFYHHYQSKEDLITQGFMSFDEELEEELKHVTETDPIKMIRYIILSLTKYVFDNGSGFAKELYISQLSISNNYITQKTRPYYQGVLSYVKKAQEQNIIKNDMDADEITSVLLRIGRGTILDWCLHDYGYDLLQQSKKDLDFMLQQFLITPNT